MIAGAPIRLAATRACFQGVELAEFPSRAARIFLDGIAAEQCMPSEVPIAVLSSTTGFTGIAHADAEAAHRVRHLVNQAAECGCKIVELPDCAGDVRKASLVKIADWLLPLADHAAEQGVTLAVCNGSVLRAVRPMWSFLERLDHPAVGCSWDLDQATRFGETPGVAVPGLGSRIVVGRFALIEETTRQFIQRLRGIGFSGWLIATSSTIEDAASLATLRSWISPKKPSKPDSKKVAVKTKA